MKWQNKKPMTDDEKKRFYYLRHIRLVSFVMLWTRGSCLQGKFIFRMLLLFRTFFSVFVIVKEKCFLYGLKRGIPC